MSSRTAEQQAAARAAVREFWQRPKVIRAARAADWLAAILGTAAVMLLASVNF